MMCAKMLKLHTGKRNRSLYVIAVLAAAIGLVDTLYLTVSHYGSSQVICNLVDGCNLVLESHWASIFGIPTSLIGVGYYVIVLLLLSAFYYWRSETALLGVLGIATVGFIISLGFLYLQLFVITAVCEYCLLSLVATTVVWVSLLGLVYSRSDTINI